MKICSVEGCGGKHKGHSYCQKHLAQAKKTGELVVDPNPPERKCSVSGCENKHKSNGYCNRHFQVYRKHGDPLFTKPRVFNDTGKPCLIDGCKDNVISHQYCSKHYHRLVRYSNPEYSPKDEIREVKICSVEDCLNESKAKGFCNTHYYRFTTYGDPLEVRHETHGLWGHPMYSRWASMKTRCSYPNAPCYKNYGGRGIYVCDRWIHSFSKFYKDMGDPPFEGAEIDRIDNDGPYSPENTQWLSKLENSRKNTSLKLDMVKAIKIRELYKKGITITELSETYSVITKTIEQVIKNHTWTKEA